jgi:hypothetical protein
LNHETTPHFWTLYKQLPDEIQRLADKNFKLLEENFHHPSLHFKKVGLVWSARVGDNYRALVVPVNEGFLWFWTGPHDEYDRLVR